MMTTDADPQATSSVELDWPRLVTLCQQRRVPVSRVDRLGSVHVLRTSEDLAAFEQSASSSRRVRRHGHA